MATDDKITLALEILGASDAKELNSQIKALKAAFAEAAPVIAKAETDVYELADAYEVLGETTKTVLTSAAQVGPAIKAAAEAAAAAAIAVAALAAAEKKAAEGAYDLADELGDSYAVLGTQGDIVTKSSARVAAAIKDIGNTAVPTAQFTENLATKLNKVEAAGKTAAKGLGKNGKESMGGGFLELSRAVEDAQYGLNGVINNIPTMVQRFGGPAGLAAAISFTAVGINLLLPQMKKLWDAINEGDTAGAVSQLDALTKKIDTLKDKKVKLAVDHAELDAAEDQLARIKKAKAESDAQDAKQTVAENKSGKAIDDVITEAGAPAIKAKVEAKYIADQTPRFGPLTEAKASQDEGDAKLREAREKRARAVTDADFAAADVLEASANAQVAAAQEKARIARQTLATNAETFYGGLLLDAIKGHGKMKAKQEEALAKELEAVGESVAAGNIRVHTAANEKKYAQQEADLKDEKKEREYEAGVRGKAQQQVIDDLSKSEAMTPDAQEMAKVANATGAAAEDAFAEVRKQITSAILAKLDEKGVGTKGANAISAKAAETAANAAAEGIAKQAFGKVGQNQTRAEKAQAKADKKSEAGDERALNAEAQANEAEIDKEVAKIKRTIGEQERNQFEQAMARNNWAKANGVPSMDPGQLASNLQAQMAQRFQGRGAGEQSARLAAKGITDHGKEDLGKRAADASMTNLNVAGQTLAITQQLVSEYQRMSAIQQQLVQEAGNQRKQMQATRPNGTKH